MLAYILFCGANGNNPKERQAYEVRPGRRDPDTGEPIALAFQHPTRAD